MRIKRVSPELFDAALHTFSPQRQAFLKAGHWTHRRTKTGMTFGPWFLTTDFSYFSDSTFIVRAYNQQEQEALLEHLVPDAPNNPWKGHSMIYGEPKPRGNPFNE